MIPPRPATTDFVQNLVLRGLIEVLKLLPYRWRVPAMGWVVGYIVGPLGRYDIRVRDNLALIFPDMPKSEVRRLMRAVPSNVGRTLIEVYSGAQFKAHVANTPIQGAGLAAILAARQTGTPREQFDAVVVLLRAAAHEYAGSIQGGQVSDVLAYHESHAFIAIARQRLGELAPSAKPAAKALTALDDAAQAYGDMGTMDLVAGDATILAAVAARVELMASQVR